MLERHVEQSRNKITVQVATAVETFEAKRISRAIYATGWDGSVVLEADTAGKWNYVDPASLVPSPSPLALGAGAPEDTNLVNINTAGVEQLAALPRMGLDRANAIVSHRASNGPFRSTEELEQVSGIGPATAVTLRSYVTVGRQ